MTGAGCWRASCDQRGQASVELALVLPAVVLLLLLALQVGLVVRDRLVVLHAVRTAARAVIVDPTPSAARDAVSRSGAGRRTTVSLSGDLGPGGYATVTVSMQPTSVPIVGRVLGGSPVTERLTVLVEG